MGTITDLMHKHVSKHLKRKRPGCNEPSTRSPAEEATTAASPRSSAEEASPPPRPPASPTPDDGPSGRLRVVNEVTPPDSPREAEQAKSLRSSEVSQEASEFFSFSGLEPRQSPARETTTEAPPEIDPYWALFLDGYKAASDDAARYYPSWSVSAPEAPSLPLTPFLRLSCFV